MNDGWKESNGETIRLVEASQAKDRSAFDKLVLFYQRRVMEAAVRILGNAEDATEAVQAGFVKAYLNIGKLKEPARFEVWLLRIITNEAINQQRAGKRKSEKVNIDSYEDRKNPSPMEKETGVELQRAVEQAIRKLTKKEAKAISLFGLEDLSHKEAAKIMGCSVEAMRWYVFAARKKLKVLLKDYL